MSKVPRGSTSSNQKQPNLWLQHQQEVGAFIRDRDQNPVEIRTNFGIWRSIKNGCAVTTYDLPTPVPIQSKQKYRPT